MTEDFETTAKPTHVSICRFCIHLDWDSLMPRCTAYQFAIPIEILFGEVDHRQPYEGDNGIQFEKAYLKTLLGSTRYPEFLNRTEEQAENYFQYAIRQLEKNLADKDEGS